MNINGRPNTKPWFTEEVKAIAETKRRAFLKSRSEQTRETYQNYVTVRNRVNSRIREIKNEYWRRFSVDMEHDMYGSQKRIWKLLRGLKKSTNESVEIKSINEDRWMQYFQRLYDDGDITEWGVDADGDERHGDDTDEQILITFEQVSDAVKKLKNRKTPSEDQISNELIKYGGKTLLQEITSLFRKILKAGKVPKEWKQSITIPLFKKGDRKEPSNYRGITLLSCVLKLLTNIIGTAMSHTIPLSEEQQGFRKNRSTVDAIFIFRQIAEKAIEYNKPAFVCFVDLTKAFDRIRLADVLSILKKKKKVPREYIQLIKELNTDNTTKLRVNKKLTTSIKTSTGIRQGDSLSPLLFNIVMEKIIEAVRECGPGYRLGQHRIHSLYYADDALLVAESEDDLQRLLYTFKNTAEKYNMKISTTKTKSMTISREPLRCKLAIDDVTIIDQVMCFDYLGVRIHSDGNLKEEVRQQVNKAATISGHLKHVIWKNKDLSIECKSRIYKTCVRPVMTYAAETRPDSAVTKRQMRTTEMKTLRAISGYTLWDRQTNAHIREKCGVGDVVRWVRGRRRAWNEHVNRMADTRLAKIARNGTPIGKRPSGRPPKRWKDSWQSISGEQ